MLRRSRVATLGYWIHDISCSTNSQHLAATIHALFGNLKFLLGYHKITFLSGNQSGRSSRSSAIQQQTQPCEAYFGAQTWQVQFIKNLSVRTILSPRQGPYVPWTKFRIEKASKLFRSSYSLKSSNSHCFRIEWASLLLISKVFRNKIILN